MKSSTKGVELNILSLSKVFEKQRVLQGIDLEIKSGEFVAIVGRSGCGKSTFLRLISGLEKPTEGGVLLDGQPLRGLNGTARLMFQDARLLMWKRVWQNVSLGLKGNSQLKATWALEQVGLKDRAFDWPAVLSGGQRQRVALARALASEPRLLLLDEPLGALDALTRIEMQQLIETLWLEQQFTVLLITHDVEEAVALADRIILIESGTIALNLSVNLSRPRARGNTNFVALVDRVLQRVMAGKTAEQQEARPVENLALI